MKIPSDASRFMHSLVATGAVLADDGTVAHFGCFDAEYQASRQLAAAIPLPQLIRIRLTGNDRAGFLHNFCTQDVNGLKPGCCAEAFFTNVKARVIAHGYVLAGTDHHEIWMLPGDEAKLISHLDRYIITEDVSINSLSTGHAAIACIGPLAAESIADDANRMSAWTDITIGRQTIRLLMTEWAGVPVVFISCAVDSLEAVWTHCTQRAIPAGLGTFERLRIEERYPIAGQDVGEDHLAPEAVRQTTAISYTKGCYLGQEPIARLDALGQVNRLLAAVTIHPESGSSDSPVELTSWNNDREPAIGLGMVRSASIGGDAIVVRLPDNSLRSASISAPTSLPGD